MNRIALPQLRCQSAFAPGCAPPGLVQYMLASRHAPSRAQTRCQRGHAGRYLSAVLVDTAVVPKVLVLGVPVPACLL